MRYQLPTDMISVRQLGEDSEPIKEATIVAVIIEKKNNEYRGPLLDKFKLQIS